MDTAQSWLWPNFSHFFHNYETKVITARLSNPVIYTRSGSARQKIADSICNMAMHAWCVSSRAQKKFKEKHPPTFCPIFATSTIGPVTQAFLPGPSQVKRLDEGAKRPEKRSESALVSNFQFPSARLVSGMFHCKIWCSEWTGHLEGKRVSLHQSADLCLIYMKRSPGALFAAIRACRKLSNSKLFLDASSDFDPFFLPVT